MKTLLASFIFAACSLLGADASTIGFDVSQGALAAGVVTNIVRSFHPSHEVVTLTGFAPQVGFNPYGLSSCDDNGVQGTCIFAHHVVPAVHPVGRTVAVSVAAVGVLVMERVIVKHHPKAAKWFALVNVGTGVEMGIH